ncbi:hypothetical protein [Treponema phagedenis]|uniref:hypothetical protein n=1 Tax=Treponema phagedenis TaxID=162 RepID=UPI001583D2A7|nr:hypothetical protein [Treponema phagedenis]QKS91120.1 hypothetical protein HPJ96_06240 [Treponema phagedenis]
MKLSQIKDRIIKQMELLCMRAVFSVDIISLTLQRKLLEELVQRFVIKVLLCLSEHQQDETFCHGRQKIRTGTDARGSTQTVWFLTWTEKSERARTPVVPSRSDVLKQDRLQSFKTRRVGFDMDVKTNP